jgi:hypothetical protein
MSVHAQKVGPGCRYTCWFQFDSDGMYVVFRGTLLFVWVHRGDLLPLGHCRFADWHEDSCSLEALVDDLRGRFRTLLHHDKMLRLGAKSGDEEQEEEEEEGDFFYNE